mmetsp:Transcript_16807/g.27340  ORF Transcript_16807/g.27340 Transcript_16807/m.27340 type:complete len:470 (+) Transcript_16807:95-1504(+)
MKICRQWGGAMMVFIALTFAKKTDSRVLRAGSTRTVASHGIWKNLRRTSNGIRNNFHRTLQRSPFKSRSISGTHSLVFNDDLEMQLSQIIKERKLRRDEKSGGRASLPAVAFDIDGVFKMGGQYSAAGAEALRKVVDAEIPYVLVTNGGGGRTEEQYANEMNKKLQAVDEKSADMEFVTGDQMILSYTPFDSDLSHLKNEPVLIVGSPRILEAAVNYGFTKAMHLSEYTCRHPTMNPFGKSGLEKDDCVINLAREEWNEDFKAILVFTDPVDFFEGIQVLTDVLLSSKPGKVEFEPERRIPIVFSNPDLLWKTQYPHARFGQGAFRLALEVCYKARLQNLGASEKEIENRLRDFVQYGKPEIAQFLHTKRALIKQAAKTGCDISHYYMVGDNPMSDIQGAINMDERARSKDEKRWSGLLVRTGVYKDGDNDLGATKIVDNVLDSVDHILDAHKEELQKLKEQKATKTVA